MKNLTVRQLKEIFNDLPDDSLDIPIVVVGDRQRVVGAGIAYQGWFTTDVGDCVVYTEEIPVAVMLQVVPI